jgi:Prenyltransferase and squalene oxidase repeat
VPESLEAQLFKFLVQSQNTDGGWGYSPGRKSAFEPTAYAMLSLQLASSTKNVLPKARNFVKTRQTAEGGWPANTTDTDPAPWVSPLVGLAVLNGDGFDETCRSAAKYVLKSFGRVPKNWRTHVSEWLGYRNPANINTDLGGWAWNLGTSPWVEPTCRSLIFLKRIRGKISEGELDRVITEGEAMLYDRVCHSGGWNYGNAQVLGEELRPYAATTALALIALIDHPRRPENKKSLTYLKHASTVERSATSLSYACLCLDLYLEPWQGLLEQVEALYRETQFFQDVKGVALALLALLAKEGKNAYRQS